MRLTALVQAIEDSSYKRKSDQSTVGQFTITGLDWDDSRVRLKDTVDITVGASELAKLGDVKDIVGSVATFNVTEIRPPGYGSRMRFTAEVADLPAKEKQQHAKTAPAAS